MWRGSIRSVRSSHIACGSRADNNWRLPSWCVPHHTATTQEQNALTVSRPPATQHRHARHYVGHRRLAELRALDATFSGVRGLVASGATAVPRIFRVPDSDKLEPNDPCQQEAPPPVPTVDLGGADHDALVAAVRRAAAEWGLFLVTGHGVPREVARAFHDADGGEGSDKAPLYSRDPARAVKYNCNFDLYQSPVANWRDTLYHRIAPDPPADGELPENCRDVFFDYARHTKCLLDKLFELLSEALGLNPSYLTDMECNQGQMILFHHYPPCPQPELAIGTTRHSDSGFLTVLLQDEIGGLQVLHDDHWVDVPPTPGAFIVNVGDLMQMISNDKFRSAEHRVVAKKAGPRVSIASFTSHSASTRMYGRPYQGAAVRREPPIIQGNTCQRLSRALLLRWVRSQNAYL